MWDLLKPNLFLLSDVLHDIIKNCTLLSSCEDDVIIKQGDRGDR